MDRTHEIEEIVYREGRAFQNQDVDLMMSIYHPDMVMPWPLHSRAYDPMEWIMRMGKFNLDRWSKKLHVYFDTHEFVHDRRVIKKILFSEEQDGALAVVDVDSLFRQKPGTDSPWHNEAGQKVGEIRTLGRAGKIYTLVNDEWKLIAQPGTMHYPVET